MLLNLRITSGNDLKTKLPQYSAKTMSSSLWTTEANGYLTFCVSVAFLYSVIFCFFNCDFLQKEPDKHLVKVGELKNGSVNLIEVDTKAPVTPGEAISEGVKVKVIGNADYGYELASVKVEGANYNEADGSFMVGTGDVTVSASFQLVKYQITSALNIPKQGKVVLKDKAG